MYWPSGSAMAPCRSVDSRAGSTPSARDSAARRCDSGRDRVAKARPALWRGGAGEALSIMSKPPAGGTCDCSPRWEAWVYSRKDHIKVRRSFAEYWEAKAWRHEQLELARNGLFSAPSRRTLEDVAGVWIVLAREGKMSRAGIGRPGPEHPAEGTVGHHPFVGLQRTMTADRCGRRSALAEASRPGWSGWGLPSARGSGCRRTGRGR